MVPHETSGFPVAQFSSLKVTAACMVVEWSPWGADGSSGAKLIKQAEHGAEHGAEESTCRDLPRTVLV